VSFLHVYFEARSIYRHLIILYIISSQCVNYATGIKSELEVKVHIRTYIYEIHILSKLSIYIFLQHHHGIIPQCINCHDIMIDIQNRVSFPHIYFETRDGH